MCQRRWKHCRYAMGHATHSRVTQLSGTAGTHLSRCYPPLQGTLRLYCVPACFLQPPGAPPLLEQRLAPQLRDLAAGRPLAQRLAGTTQPRQRPIESPGVAWWYPCPQLRSRVRSCGMSLPTGVQQCLVPEGSTSAAVDVQILGVAGAPPPPPPPPPPAAAAAAATAAAATAAPAAQPPQPLSPPSAKQQHAPDSEQQTTGAAAADGDTGGSSVHWALLQQEGLAIKVGTGNCVLQGTAAWRRMSGPYGHWYLFKAQAVRGNRGPVKRGQRTVCAQSLLPVVVSVLGRHKPPAWCATAAACTACAVMTGVDSTTGCHTLSLCCLPHSRHAYVIVKVHCGCVSCYK
jgi:hypothetical protein